MDLDGTLPTRVSGLKLIFISLSCLARGLSQPNIALVCIPAARVPGPVLSKQNGFPVILLRLLNDFFKLREEEREAIETGIEDTKKGLQLEDIQLIQEFNLVSIE
jgi:hypothetical protein